MPGATRERRRTYVDEAPKMVDFLVTRAASSSDAFLPGRTIYKAPGESVPGRTVVSELFDLNQLGEWQDKTASRLSAVARKSRRGHAGAVVQAQLGCEESAAQGDGTRDWRQTHGQAER